MNAQDLKNWLKAWQELKSQSEIALAQASIVMPIIEQKIKELEEVEVQEVKNG